MLSEGLLACNIERARCYQTNERGFKLGVTEKKILRIIGKNVKAARLKAGLTQECLAEMVGVHWQTITYLEQGRAPFSVVTFARLTQALETSGNRLLADLPEMDRKRMARIKKAKARQRRPKGSDGDR